MSEEENKAIEDIKELVFGNISEITIYDKDGYTMWNNDLETVLNLIEKQQKQLEVQKNTNKNLSKENQKYFDLSMDLYSNIVNIKEILDKVEMSDYNSTVNALLDIRRILNED